MADLEAVARAAVDADDLLGAGLADLAGPAVDRNYPAPNVACRRVRRIADRLRPSCRNQLVARADFLHRARQFHRGGLPAALEPRRPAIDRLIRERLVAVRINQRPSAAVDVPGLFLGSAYAAHVRAVAGG